MNSSLDAYKALKKTASSRKLRGARLLAEGGGERSFEASVVLHEAARLEARAFALLSDPSSEARLEAAVEECGCLTDARDPRWAEVAWRKIQAVSSQVNAELRQTMLARLENYYLSQQNEFRRAVSSCSVLVEQIRRYGNLRPERHSVRLKLLKELSGLVREFPGDAHLWFSISQLEEAQGRLVPAFEAMWRATQLQPSETGFRLLALKMMSELPELQGTYLNRVREIWKNIEIEDHETCVFFSLLVMELSRLNPEQREALLDMAGGALSLAESKAAGPHFDVRHLKAAKYILNEKRQGRDPTVQDLVLAGFVDAGEDGELEEAGVPAHILSEMMRRKTQRSSDMASPLAAFV